MKSLLLLLLLEYKRKKEGLKINFNLWRLSRSMQIHLGIKPSRPTSFLVELLQLWGK